MTAYHIAEPLCETLARKLLTDDAISAALDSDGNAAFGQSNILPLRGCDCAITYRSDEHRADCVHFACLGMAPAWKDVYATYRHEGLEGWEDPAIRIITEVAYCEVARQSALADGDFAVSREEFRTAIGCGETIFQIVLGCLELWDEDLEVGLREIRICDSSIPAMFVSYRGQPGAYRWWEE